MAGEDSGYDFFIAHRGDDTDEAKRLHRFLARNHRVFLDSVTLRPGARWPRELPEAQRNSRVTVVLIADQQSHYQTEEVIRAVQLANVREAEHLLVPVYLVGSGRPPNPPYGLAGFNPIMAEDEGGLEGVARKLGTLIDVAEPQQHRDDAVVAEGVLIDRLHGQDGWVPVAPVPERDFGKFAELAPGPGVPPDVGAITSSLLSRYEACVVPIGPGRGDRRPLSPSEVRALVEFGMGSHGLMLLGTYAGDWHHLWNLNDVARSFGMRFDVDAVTRSGLDTAGYGDVNANYPEDRGAFVALAVDVDRDNPLCSRLLDGVKQVAVAGCCTLRVAASAATPILVTDSRATRWEPEPTGIKVGIRKYLPMASAGPEVIMAASLECRVAAIGSWKIFSDAFVERGEYDNGKLLENTIAWLTDR